MKWFFLNLFRQKSVFAAVTLMALPCPAGSPDTHIGPSRPSSLVKPGPDTGQNKSYRSATYITAFSQLHLDGKDAPGVLGIMPCVGELRVDQEDYCSRFDPSESVTDSGYYSVMLEDHNVRTDITAMDKVVLYRFTFPESEESHVLVDVSHALSAFQGGEVHLFDGKTIEGTTKYKVNDGAPIEVAYSIQFSKPFRRRGVWKSGHVMDGHNRAKVDDDTTLGAFVYFKTHEGETILMKVGISNVDIGSARKNIESEFPGWDFDEVRRESEQVWKKR